MTGTEAGADTRPPQGVRVAVVASLLTAAALAVGVGVVAAGHGPDGSNFTYTPLSADDRQPGATETRVGQIGRAAGGIETDFKTLLRLRAVWRAGSWEGCGPDSSEVFGVDRGSDNEPYNVDESLTTSVKSFTANENVFESKFYDEDEFGKSVTLNSEDRIFTVIECPNNPAEAGWHRIDSSSVKGRTTDGEIVTYEDHSHWFWICRCEDETAAREALGPPPSEPDGTPIPTPTMTDRSATPGARVTPTAADGSRANPSDGTAVMTDAGGPAVTPTAEPTAAATASATRSPTPPTGEWMDYQYRTPTVGDGGGFAPILAIGALLVMTALRRRPRR
jgi:hypothetical protein